MKKTNWGWREADMDVHGEHIELRLWGRGDALRAYVGAGLRLIGAD